MISMAESKQEELEKVSETSSTTTSSLPAATDLERELAHKAQQEFERCQYDSALTLLAQLIASRGHDPKVLHNQAVVEYYKADMATTDEFKKALQDISLKDKRFGILSLDQVVTLEDVDNCIMYYNHAVILYHLRQYSKSLLIVDKLFQHIEPMEESLSRKVLFLLIELYLCTHQPEKALGIIAFLDKMLFGNGKTSQVGEKDGLPLPKEGPPEVNPANEIYRSKVNMYKVRCFMMMRTLKSCKRELKGLLNMANTNIPVTYLKANFEYFRNNFRKAIKVLNSVPQTLRTTTDAGQSLAMMYYNNLGIIHFHLKKHNLGAFYLRKAIHENALAVKEYNTVDPTKTLSGRPVNTLAISRHYELLYNMGVELLHCKKATVAFDCLVQTVQHYQVNPRLWLRLAECCIMVNKEDNLDDRKLSKRLQVIQGSEGSGVHRKLILGPGLEEEMLSSESSVIPAPTLEFASLCLRNALMLLPEDPALRKSPGRSTDRDLNEARLAQENVIVPAPPSNPMRGSEVINLRCSILASSAYVSLCLNDHLVALQHAEQLLKQPRLSGAHSYLGHLYQAEALVALDRIADGISHLDPDLVSDVTTTFPESKADIDKERNGDRDPGDQQDTVKGAVFPWSPREVPQARAITQYNLATAHAIRGEYNKALLNLEQSTIAMGSPVPTQVYYLKVYLELMEGRRKTTQNFIKEHFGHVTPNRV